MGKIQQILSGIMKPTRSNLERWILYIVSFLLLLMVLKGCFDTKRLEGEATILKKENKELVIKVIEDKKAYQLVTDSITKVTKAKNDTIRVLRENTKKSYIRIKNLESGYVIKIKQLDKWNNKQSVQFFQDYYKTKFIVETPQGVELQNDTPKKVIKSLFEGDKYKLESQEKDIIIINKNTEISIEQSKTKDALFERDKADDVIFGQGELINNQGDLLKNSNKQINRLKAQRLIYQIGVPAAIIAGVAAGLLIAK